MSRIFQGLTVGALVVVNHELDATIYRIKAIKGFGVGVIDAELDVTNQATQWHDRSLCMGLSVCQIKAYTARGAGVRS